MTQNTFAYLISDPRFMQIYCTVALQTLIAYSLGAFLVGGASDLGRMAVHRLRALYRRATARQRVQRAI